MVPFSSIVDTRCAKVSTVPWCALILIFAQACISIVALVYLVGVDTLSPVPFVRNDFVTISAYCIVGAGLALCLVAYQRIRVVRTHLAFVTRSLILSSITEPQIPYYVDILEIER